MVPDSFPHVNPCLPDHGASRILAHFPKNTMHCASPPLRGDMASCILAYFTKKSMHRASPLLREDRASCILAYFAYFFQFKKKKVSITERHRWYGPLIAKSQQAGDKDKLEKVCKVCKYAGGLVLPQEWVRAVHTLF